MPTKFPWKQNFLKLPKSLETKLNEIEGDLIKVAGTKAIPLEDLTAGLYGHLGLTYEDGAVCIGQPLIPPADIGKWSKRNGLGWDRIRQDWPKVEKTWTIESPNFGDGTRNGYSTRFWTKEVYQHQIFEPQGMTISTSVLQNLGGEKVVVNFELDPILSREMPEFDLMLLWAINVVKENTGVADIFSSDSTKDDFLKTISLDWQIFPSGSAEEVMARLQNAQGGNDVEFNQEIQERVEFFETFDPVAYIRGQGGFGSYFGAQFDDDFVVFENLKYGNAIYLLYEDWVKASRRSRLDLLRDKDASFDRVPHTDGWQSKLTALLQQKLYERGLSKRRPSRRLPRRRR